MKLKIPLGLMVKDECISVNMHVVIRNDDHFVHLLLFCLEVTLEPRIILLN